MKRISTDKPENKCTRREALSRLGAVAIAAQLPVQQWAGPADERDRHARPLMIDGKHVALSITPITAKTLRITLSPCDEKGNPQPLEADPVLIKSDWPAPALQLNSITSPRRGPWGGFQVLTTTQPLSISFQGDRSRIVPRVRIEEDGTVAFQRGVAPLFGLGEGGAQFDRAGNTFPPQNGQGPGLDVLGARVAIPLIVSADGWAMFFHRPFGSFELSDNEARFIPSSPGGSLPVDVFLIASENPADIFTEYANLTGFPQLPPIWSLGYQQSHRTLSSREEVLSEAKEFREKKLPCDLMIYLGTGFCPSGWNTGHGSFTFNEKVFPDPEKMISELHKEHFRVALHVVLQARHLHGRVSDTGQAALDPEDVAHYWAEHLADFRMGVDGWWPDEGDWLPPIERLIRNRMYWEGPIQARPNVRPYALHRNGYAGMQRYGWLWSGDVESTWQTLEAQVPVGINTGMSGMPFWGTDTGGFVTTPELTGELYVRWFQFSTFCPLFRSHGRTWKLRLPWGWDTGEYGPEELTGYRGMAGLPARSELHNAQVEPICRKYLDLRYQLMPYTYSVVRESHDTGLPIMRALWLHHADDPQAVERGDEYLWGRSLLVAPVTEKGAAKRRLYLPRGKWYDFWKEEIVDGGIEFQREVDLATMPLYVRAGSILPMGPVKQYTTEPSSEPMTIVIYPGADAEFVLYEDDGVSFDYERGECTRLRMAYGDKSREVTLSLAEGSKLLGPAPRTFIVRVAGSDKRQTIKFDGTAKTITL